MTNRRVCICFFPFQIATPTVNWIISFIVRVSFSLYMPSVPSFVVSLEMHRHFFLHLCLSSVLVRISSCWFDVPNQLAEFAFLARSVFHIFLRCKFNWIASFLVSPKLSSFCDFFFFSDFATLISFKSFVPIPQFCFSIVGSTNWQTNCHATDSLLSVIIIELNSSEISLHLQCTQWPRLNGFGKQAFVRVWIRPRHSFFVSP